jgi:hypothetical protein
MSVLRIFLKIFIYSSVKVNEAFLGASNIELINLIFSNLNFKRSLGNFSN